MSTDIELTYRDSDGALRKVTGCNLHQDKAGRYWLWSETLQHNLAYRIKSKEDCLLAAIDSLLFSIQLRNERIAELQKIADLATAFADQIKPDEEEL